MNRSIASNLVALTLGGALLGTVTLGTAKAADACRQIEQASCTADVGCKWKTAEVWKREGDGKTRTVKARCAYDAKAGRQIVQTMLASKN